MTSPVSKTLLSVCPPLVLGLAWCTLCLGGESPVPVRVSKIGDFIQLLQWSPDGKKFLFTRIHAGKMGLWTVNVDGSELTQLLPKANTPHFDGHWSPDSKRIVFVYDILQGTDGKLQIDVMNADGAGQ